MIYEWLPRDNTRQTKTRACLGAANFEYDDTFEKLKLVNNVSEVEFQLPRHGSPFENSKKCVDGLTDLLRSNNNITRLEITSFRTLFLETDHCGLAKAYLLNELANGEAGEHLESLHIHPTGTSRTDDGETLALGKYLRRNRNLKRLHLDLRGQADLQPMPILQSTSVTHLSLTFWGVHQNEISGWLGCCSSMIVSLEIFLLGLFAADTIDAIGSFVSQRRNQGENLEHICIGSNCIWGNYSGLGLALRSVKSVSLQMNSEAALLEVLPHLMSCETLDIQVFPVTDTSQLFRSIIPSMPKLQTISVSIIEWEERGYVVPPFHDDFLEMVKASDTITKVALQLKESSPVFEDKVSSFCLTNRVLGLLGFGPSELWTRALSKIRDDSAKANVLYRLLREKPELILGSTAPASEPPLELS